MSQDYEVGDFVWAKMKGYPPWPAKIAEPRLDAKPPKKKAHFVYFFGSKNFAWILDENISPHSESILNSLNKNKSGAYQSAIDDFLKSCKSNKEKPVTPKKEKPVNEAKKLPYTTKVVKIINSVPRKQVRKVILGKAVKKVARKRSQSVDNDIDGSEAEYRSPKKSKTESSPIILTELYNSFSDIASISSSDNTFSMNDRMKDLLKRKHVSPSKLKIGFIGLGHMGKAIVNNLLSSGHKVYVYNKTIYKCDAFLKKGAKIAKSPADLVIKCNITICCVSDPDASKSLIFQEKGILKGLEQSEKLGLKEKGYVEMTSLDPRTSAEIAEAVERKRGRYLEAPVCGTSQDALEGTLLVLAAGNNKLFYECETCFHAIGKKAYYISCEAGSGAKMSIILSALSGTMCGALAEAMVLSKRLSLSESELINTLREGSLEVNNLIDKGKMMLRRDFKTITPLKHMQKDMQFCLELGQEVDQHMPVFAAVNEVYKRARLLKYSDYDVSAVFHGIF